jgi:integrase
MSPILGRGSETHRQVLQWPYAARNKALFILGVRSGFRISEILSLTVGDVLQHGKVMDHVTVARKHMKKKTEGRGVPLHPEARAALSV